MLANSRMEMKAVGLVRTVSQKRHFLFL